LRNRIFGNMPEPAFFALRENYGTNVGSATERCQGILAKSAPIVCHLKNADEIVIACPSDDRRV